MSRLLLLLAALAAPLAGPSFHDSSLGYQLGGRGVLALDERWLSDLGAPNLLLRVERDGDSGSVAVYAMTKPPTADAGAVFEERLRVATVTAPEIEEVRSVSLGKLGPAVIAQLREALPDDVRGQLIVIGKGPQLILDTSYAESEPSVVRFTPTERSYALDTAGDAPTLRAAWREKVLSFTGADGGVEVEVGYTEEDFVASGEALVAGASRYHDLVPSVPLHSPSEPQLTDGKLDSGATLKVGKTVRLALDAPAPIRMLRVVPSCSEGRGGVAQELQLTVGDGGPIDVVVGKPVVGSGVFASGVFDLGPGGGEQELVLLDPPVVADHLALTLVRGSGPGKSACVAEVSAHTSAR